MARRSCRICGADVGSAEFSLCGRQACQRADREPGSDDDGRKPTRCIHCGVVGRGQVCPQCVDLLSDLGEYDDDTHVTTPPPAAPKAPDHDQWLLLERLSAAADRRVTVWLQGRISLLSRCASFGPMAVAQPR